MERTDISKVAMLIEEPEAHLHPIKQRMIADIISFFVNAGTYMQITTHSDYFLRRLNELINLKKISQRSMACSIICISILHLVFVFAAQVCLICISRL